MDRKLALVLVIFLIVVLISGCVGEDTTQPTDGDKKPSCKRGKTLIGDVCCEDKNTNKICDGEEGPCPTSCDDGNPCTEDTCSLYTYFKCEHTNITPCCGNGVCETKEEIRNVCPEDCEILDITDFEYEDIPDFMEDDTFVFIHTTAEQVSRIFFLNITADEEEMEHIRFTFKCNSTHGNLDSIDSETENITHEIQPKINKLDTSHYLIYSYFFLDFAPIYGLEIEKLNLTETAQFHFKVMKKEPQKRDTLTCAVKLYFIKPRKMVEKMIEISYI